MFLFFSREVKNNSVILRSEEHNHCKKVLRKNIGDTLHITDGQGKIFLCRIDVIDKDKTECFILETDTQAPFYPRVAVAIAPVKNMSRIEWFLEKATEIGITDIYLMMTQRSEKKSIKIERLEKIVVSAMKQSLKAFLPQLHFFESFKECLQSTQEPYKDKFIGYCEESEGILYNCVSKHNDTIIFIGPEGDFTEDEISLAKSMGIKTVSLGESRLRTETAGLVALMTQRLKSQNM